MPSEEAYLNNSNLPGHGLFESLANEHVHDNYIFIIAN